MSRGSLLSANQALLIKVKEYPFQSKSETQFQDEDAHQLYEICLW